MSATAWCPVERVVGSYGISSNDIARLVRMNWRMVVLEIVAAHEGAMPYSDIASESGLNSRTLSIILRELTKERLLDKHGPSEGSGRAGYSASMIGKRIATMPCPILRFASERKR